MSKKSSAQHSITIKCKVKINRNLEITYNSFKIEINDEGIITSRYTGIQLTTIDNNGSKYYAYGKNC